MSALSVGGLNTLNVALLSLPFATFTAPSLGVSLLQASLRRKGISCDIHYLNLRFASRIGCLSYLTLGVDSPPTSLAGEWLFAGDLFGAHPERDAAFIQTVLKGKFPKYFQPRVLRRLLEVRACVPRFLDDCFKRVPWERYDVVGFTSSFQQNLASLALAQRVKQAFPDKIIVFGGANCEGEMGIELHRQFPFIDFVCSGEGDLAFPELVRRLAAGNETGEIPGIISRVDGQTIVPREIVSPVTDLDALPYPCYDDYFSQARALPFNRRFTPEICFETSRGCWWGAKMHCTFCGLNGATMAYRSKTPRRALEELIYLGERYGTRILAADNILDLKYLDSFFPQLAAHNLRFDLQFETKVNLTKKQLQLLRDSGVTALQPGIESLSSSVLKLMKKGCTLLQNVQFLKWAKQMGIEAGWNLLYGFPGESPTDYLEMAQIIPFLIHLSPPQSCGKVRMDRFSPYFARPSEYGLENVRPYAAYSHVYGLEPEVLRRLAYYFEFDHPQEESLAEYARPVVDRVAAWKSSRRRGSLTGKLDGDTLLLADTRKGCKKSTLALREPLRTAYIFCDQVRPFSTILAHLSLQFPSGGITGACLGQALDDLVSRGFMLKDGKSYLSLAVLPFLVPDLDSPLPNPGDEKPTVPTLVQLSTSPQPPANLA